MGCLRENGFLSIRELAECNRLPSEERYQRGAVAVLECCQDIPCNPCEDACPFGAIRVGKPITNLPVLDEDKCTGCGTCIAHCSGLAIFVVNKVYNELEATVSFPFEYLPLPAKGQVVDAVDRSGRTVCKGTVVRIVDTKKNDHTPVVTVAVPREYADEVRSIRRLTAQEETKPLLEYVYESGDPDDILICRCEEVTVGTVRRAIAAGASSVTDVKRMTRAGMGLCQGRTCGRLIARILSGELRKKPQEVKEDSARPPMKPISLSAFLEK
ncbi:MAG: (2Fe-2S)-binding protein [Lachnospiraceae bacterium]|nr:(2Fe-2S)-binding protein [Lachnospiraceae bacterium]